MFGRYCDSGSGHVVVSGSPRQDLIKEIETVDDSYIQGLIKGRCCILWTPHFSVSSTGKPLWSSFEEVKDIIINEAKKRKNTHFIIFRPHPLLFHTLRTKGGWDDKKETLFKKTLDDIENIFIDDNGSYLPAFKAANALMADAGSFLLEFLLTEKPTLYLSPKDGLGLNDDKDILNILYDNKNINIPDFMTNVQKKYDPLKSKRKTAIPRFFYQPDEGTVGDKIINEIADGILKNDIVEPQSKNNKENQSSRAKSYWEKANNSYLAPENYYNKAEKLFDNILKKYGPWHSALDIGCSDATFTIKLSKYCSYLEAIDISSSLIKQAQEKIKLAKITNTECRVESLDSIRHAGKYNLVTCMGVLSGFIEEPHFAITLSRLHAMVKERGVLILKESLSTELPRIVTDNNSGYTAKYRNKDQYIYGVEQAGFILLEEFIVSENPDGLLNSYFIFKRA